MLCDEGQWQARFQALGFDKPYDEGDVALVDGVKYHGALRDLRDAAENLSQRDELIVIHLIQELKRFGDHYYNTLKHFPEDFHTLADALPGAQVLTKDGALDIVLNRLSNDVRVIEQIITQRTVYRNNRSGSLTRALAQADALANYALERIAKIKLIDGDDIPPVITVFEKTPAIRVMPYTKVAVLALPHAMMYSPRDFLAVAHEVGHYVFWHTGFTQSDHEERVHEEFDRLYREQIAADEKAFWQYAWVEEIFADAFGTAIGGPLMALNAVQVMSSYSRADYSGQSLSPAHPTPIVRPLVHRYVLEHFGKNPRRIALTEEYMQEIIQAFEDKRNSLKAELGINTGTKVDAEHGRVRLPMQGGRLTMEDQTLSPAELEAYFKLLFEIDLTEEDKTALSQPQAPQGVFSGVFSRLSERMMAEADTEEGFLWWTQPDVWDAKADEREAPHYSMMPYENRAVRQFKAFLEELDEQNQDDVVVQNLTVPGPDNKPMLDKSKLSVTWENWLRRQLRHAIIFADADQITVEEWDKFVPQMLLGDRPPNPGMDGNTATYLYWTTLLQARGWKRGPHKTDPGGDGG